MKFPFNFKTNDMPFGIGNVKKAELENLKVFEIVLDKTQLTTIDDGVNGLLITSDDLNLLEDESLNIIGDAFIEINNTGGLPTNFSLRLGFNPDWNFINLTSLSPDTTSKLKIIVKSGAIGTSDNFIVDAEVPGTVFNQFYIYNDQPPINMANMAEDGYVKITFKYTSIKF